MGGRRGPKLTRGASDLVHLLGQLPPATSTDVCKLCAVEDDSDEEEEETERQHRLQGGHTRKSSDTSAGNKAGKNQSTRHLGEVSSGSESTILSRLDISKLQNLSQFNITFYPHPTRHALLNKPIKFNVSRGTSRTLARWSRFLLTIDFPLQCRIPMAYPSSPPVVRCVSKWFLDSHSSYFQINPDDGRVKLAILQANTSNGNYFGARTHDVQDGVDAVGWLRTYNLASAAYALHQQLQDPLKISPRLVTIGDNCVANKESHSFLGNVNESSIRDNAPVLNWGQAEAKGRRPQMEDAMNAGVEIDISKHINLLNAFDGSKVASQGGTISRDASSTIERSAHLFGVYDGHGGSRVSEYIAEQMQRILQNNLNRVCEQDCIQQSILKNNRDMWGQQLEKKKASLSADFRLAAIILHALRCTFSSLDAEYTRSLIEHAEKFASKMGTSATEAFGLNSGWNDASESQGDSILPSWPCDLPTEQECRTAAMLDGSGSTVCACLIVRPRETSVVGNTPNTEHNSGSATESSLTKKGVVEKNINRLIYKEPLRVGATDFSLPLGNKMSTYNFGYNDVDTAAILSASSSFESNDTAGFAVLAHAGDSRAVMAVQTTDGEGQFRLIALELTHDHKAEPSARPDETARIAAAGGAVMQGRVSGRLAVARAVGDPSLKWGVDTKMELKEGSTKRTASSVPERVETHYPPLLVTSDPELCLLPLDSTCSFLILACDGLWDVVSSQDAVNEVVMVVKNWSKTASKDKNEAAATASQRLVDLALEKGTMDNVSVSVVLLQDPMSIVSRNNDVETDAVNIWQHYDAEDDIENTSATLLNKALQHSQQSSREVMPATSSKDVKKSTSSAHGTETDKQESEIPEKRKRGSHKPVGAAKNPANPFARESRKPKPSQSSSGTTAKSTDPATPSTVTDHVGTYGVTVGEGTTSTKPSNSTHASSNRPTTDQTRQSETFKHSGNRALEGSYSSRKADLHKKQDSLSSRVLQSNMPESTAKSNQQPKSARHVLDRPHSYSGPGDDTLSNLLASVQRETSPTQQGQSGGTHTQPSASRASSHTRRRSTPLISASLAVSPGSSRVHSRPSVSKPNPTSGGGCR